MSSGSSAPAPPAGQRETLSTPRRVALSSATLACTIGVLALVGWATDIEPLTSIEPRFIPILPITALAVAVGGTAAMCIMFERMAAARFLALFVAAVGVLTLISRFVGHEVFHLGFLFRAAVAEHPYRPVGVPATNSGVVLTCIGVALLLLTHSRRWPRRVARILASVAATIAAVALVGHAYGAQSLYAVDRAAGMALITAIAFLALSTATLLSHPHEGTLSLLTGHDLAGRVMRRLLPMTIAFPLVAGWLQLHLRASGIVSREVGVAIFVVLSVAWILSLLLYISSYIRAADRERNALLRSEQDARAAAEAANRAKSDFLAVMSHELRTPLNAIVGYVELLVEGIAGPVNEAQKAHLGRIQGSARHLTQTVSDILKFARIEAREETVQLTTVPVRLLLDQVGDMLAPLARAKGLALDVCCDHDGPVVTDEHRVKQILINLGGNAVKFTPRGRVALHAYRRDGALLVDVEDSGIGIASEHLERVFEPFWQVESSLTRNYEGAGLGLAVSQRLAQQLGGDISVTSTPGVGSTFTLRLPTSQ